MKSTRKPLKVSERKNFGTSLIEMPVVIWIIIACFVFPFLILATLSLRAVFVTLAAKEAAHTAAKAKTFQATSTEEGFDTVPAVTAAQNTVDKVKSTLTGTRINRVTTQILTTSIATKAVSVSSAPLSSVDTSKSIYAIKVTVAAELDPIITFNLGMFGRVPGLTGPFPLNAESAEMSENPQGLTR
ncbi:MAG: hypothetical protein K2X93_17600 [Candidatus Obscuribacterales bacterium]|nr:hypothetical protein [Candidatus Obscuribacterales bacterium]